MSLEYLLSKQDLLVSICNIYPWNPPSVYLIGINPIVTCHESCIYASIQEIWLGPAIPSRPSLAAKFRRQTDPPPSTLLRYHESQHRGATLPLTIIHHPSKNGHFMPSLPQTHPSTNHKLTQPPSIPPIKPTSTHLRISSACPSSIRASFRFFAPHTQGSAPFLFREAPPSSPSSQAFRCL